MSSDSLPSQPVRGSLVTVFFIVVIDLLGFGAVLPLVPLYVKQFSAQYDLSGAELGWTIGLLMSSFSAMQFLFLPIWGRLSDLVGRRPILIVGLVGSVVFYFLFGLASAWQSIAWMFVARIGAGIAGGTISTAQAYIADTTGIGERAKGMALIGAAFALGFTIGPLLGVTALLADRGEAAASPWPGYVASGLSALALAMTIALLPESRRPGSPGAQHSVLDLRGFWLVMATPSIALLMFTSFVAIFSFANFESTLSLQIDRLAGGTEAGALLPLVDWLAGDDPTRRNLVTVLATFTYLGFVLTLAQGFLVRRLAGRISEGAMVVSGGLCAMAGFGLLALAVSGGQFWLVFAAMTIEIVGFSLVNPSIQSLISRRTSPNHQGRVLGLAQSFSALARILGPVFGVRLFTVEPALPYVAATLLMGIGLLMSVVAVRGGRDFTSG